MPRNDVHHLGNVYVGQVQPLNRNAFTLSNAVANTAHMFSNVSLRERISSPLDMDYTNSKTNKNTFSNWIDKRNRAPGLEITIDRAPLYLCSHRNYLFSVDDKERLLLFSATSTDSFEFVLAYDIPLPPKSVRSIAANTSFFALTYSINQEKEKKFLSKEKKLKPNGVALYTREKHVINFKEPLIIESSHGESFESPVGIALNEAHVFVCDSKLKTIFKFDIRRSECLRRIRLTDGGEPYKLSLNQNYLILSDTLNHNLNLYDADNLGLIKSLFIDQADRKNGPYTVHLTSDNCIFYKNHVAGQLSLIDVDLQSNHVFNRIEDQIQGFTVIECSNNQILVVGCIEKNNRFKLVCYFNS